MSKPIFASGTPRDSRSASQIVDRFRQKIRGLNLPEAITALDGQDLIFATAAIQAELGSTNAEILRALGWQ